MLIKKKVMSSLPVVNVKRMRRITPPDDGFKFDMNAACTLMIAVGMLILYKRYNDISRRRAQFRN